MWWGSGSDPPGSGGEGSSQDPGDPEHTQLLDLQEQFEQQQTLIAQLKEMLRKSDQPVNREKVEEYASTLNKLNARAKKKKKESKKTEDDTEVSSESAKKVVATPSSEKLNLLRQQLEENKAKLAQRDRNKKGIEEMVNQLKAQLDDSQIVTQVTNQPEVEPQVSYTYETSKENLFNIINLKDKSIEDLTAKLHQFEANVLDLQENVKEKDSVIDARTKAITLLSENLSKKGKNTLDMLDETKEQMRSMQENFVSLETTMKNENNGLLYEIDIKNTEIKKLKDEIDNLKLSNDESKTTIENLNSEIVKYRSEMSEYEMKLTDLNKINNDLQNRITEYESSGKKRNRNKSKSKDRSDSQKYLDKISELEKTIKELTNETEKKPNENVEEITKLKKQLEEMNKNMIKMKAQHKAKLKDMQKKTGVKDDDGKLKVMEADISNLNQKIAELEEEKGNLQLRLVDFEANKDKEQIEDLENKIEEQRMEIENHIRTIGELEKQISSSLNEISSLKTELVNLVHIENAQVCSEMTSVQLEEQLDKEVLQNKELHEQYNQLIKDNEEHLQKIETLNKEKQELATKLENYMQENIELLDRLEKLSAEKVSSAESIEIVESLTQQEKLEIEEYQKNIENFEKESDELDQNPDLNDSVTKLTEETSELMEKIELFAAERREVMEKMDLLTTENQQLTQKLENLTTEKNTLKSENEKLFQNYAIVEKQNIELQEKHNGSTQLYNETKQKIDDLNNVVNELRNEIQQKSLQETNAKEQLLKTKEDVRNELESLHQYNATLEKESETIRLENEALNDKMSELTVQLEEKIRLNDNNYEIVENLSAQLSEVKTMFTENLNDIQKYESELQNNATTIETLNDQLNDLNYKIVETEHLLEIKNSEISMLHSEKSSLENKIAGLENELSEKNKHFNDTCEKLKEKCHALEGQIKVNSGSLEDIKGPFEKKIKELETKNKGLVEKTKKIAANLKKKVSEYNELESKFKNVTEKWENESKEKEEYQVKVGSLTNQVQEFLSEIHNLKMNIEFKSTQCEEFQLNIENQCQKIQELISENNAFRDQIMSLTLLNNNQHLEIEHFSSKLLELSTQLQNNEKDIKIQQLSDKLHNLETNYNISSNAMSAKLQENAMVIENLETDNLTCKEKMSVMQEKLLSTEKRKEKLEKRMVELSAQLQNIDIENAAQIEDILEESLRALVEQNGKLQKDVHEVNIENQVLQEKLQEINDELSKLQVKFNENEFILKQYESSSDRIISLENENIQLTENVRNLEHQVVKQQNEYEKKLLDKQSEVDSMEVELNTQLEELNLERKNLLTKCEMLQDSINEYTENEQEQTDEIDRLKQKISDLQQDLDKQLFETQINLTEIEKNPFTSHEITIDDPVMPHEVISNDPSEIVFQRQTAHLQTSGAPTVNKLTETLTELNNAKINIVKLNEEIAMLRNEVYNKQTSIEETAQREVDNIILKAERIVEESNGSLNTKTEELRKKIKTLEFMLYTVEKEKDDAVSQCHELSNELTRLIYERQKLIGDNAIPEKNRPADLEGIESQIITGDADVVDSKKELTALDFTSVNTPEVSSSFDNEVHENIVAKTTYKCYSDKNEEPPKLTDYFRGDYGNEDFKIQEAIESQILKESDTKISPEEQKLFQSIEFEHVTIPNPAQTSDQPCDEHISDPKKSYLCYPTETQENVVFQDDIFGREEDGWGWNAEEAKLEEEHRQQLNAPLQETQKILETKIRDLEAERLVHVDEIKNLQIRSSKLVKKLKELKQVNETLKKNNSGNQFDDLDMAIHDELNLQIKNLEKKVKEQQEELSKNKTENDNLLKRIDVLTSANERMIELKEKQDNDIQVWQFRNRELASKLERFEWGDDTNISPQRSEKTHGETNVGDDENLVQKLQELTQTVNDLTADNEEMQCMLEEQRNLRIEAETASLQNEKSKHDLEIEIASLKQKLSDNEVQIKDVLSRNDALKTDVIRYIEIYNDLQQQLESLKSEHVELIQETDQNEIQTILLQRMVNDTSVKYETDMQKFKLRIACFDDSMSEKNLSIELLTIEKNDLLYQIQELKNTNNNSEMILNERLKSLVADLETSNNELVSLNNKLDESNLKLVSLSEQLTEKDRSIELLNVEKADLLSRVQELVSNTDNPELQKLNERITSLTTDIEAKNREITLLNNQLTSERSEFEQKLSVTIEQLNNEWMVKVDQRGNDVAESWKLHVDTRENEFMSIENQLKSELSDLYKLMETLKSDNENLSGKVVHDVSDETVLLHKTISEKQKELDKLSQQINEVNCQLQKKNEEILLIKQSSEQTKGLEVAKMKNNLIEVEEKYEEIISNKESDIENLRIEITEKSERLKQNAVEIENLTWQISEIETKLRETTTLSDQETKELSELRNIVDYQSKEIEKLTTELSEKTRNYELVLHDLQTSKQTVDFLNQFQSDKTAQYNAITSEIERLNEDLSLKSTNFETLAAELENRNQTISELQQQLLEKTTRLNSLISEHENLKRHHRHEISTPVHEKHVTFREPAVTSYEPIQKAETPVQTSLEDNISDPVSGAELDIALYMLHQRDVRCEELTLELMQLLEERDTLQLRLSNAIRLNEELRSSMNPSGENLPPESKLGSPKKNTGAIPKSKSTAIVLGAIGTELAAEATELSTTDVQNEDKDKLASKISELRSIGYRDKTLKEDQESRHLQQLSLMEQHKDLASRLPAEAVARLVDANYTLSRDFQSPSKVILNWLWGRSTPKVNDV